jgi:histone-lysine N-methyltransferase SUV420H
MTEEEEQHMKSSRRDFSIVVSSRNKSASLFLGPARFANHDCGANARLMTTGSAGMEIIAVRDIEIGEEITVSYGKSSHSSDARKFLILETGENYFGEDNCECLCVTCEENCQNGWLAGADGGATVIPKESIEEEPSSSYSFRRRRRLGSSDSSRNQSETPEITIRPHVPKRTPRSLSRFKNQESPLGKSPSTEPSQTPRKRKRELENLLTPSPHPKKARPSPLIKMEESNLSFSTSISSDHSPSSTDVASRVSSLSPSCTDGQTGTDATSVDEDTIIVEPRIISPTVSRLRKSRNTKQSPLDQAKSREPILIGKSTNASHPVIQDDADSVLSELNSEMFDLSERSTPLKAKEVKKEVEEENNISVSPKIAIKKKKGKGALPRPTTDLDHAPPVRIPRDYVFTPRLLAEPASAWINCKICEEPFVQKDAYFTRSSCPRCERHSKLYGYMWPKTDKEGKHDTEERVLDHRTVHRFVRPEEERSIRKRNKSEIESRAVTREVSEVVEEPVEKGRKRGKRSRVTM